MNIDNLDLNFLIEEKDTHYPGPSHGLPVKPLQPQDGNPAEGPGGKFTGNDTIDGIIAGGTALGLLLWYILGGGAG